MRWIIRLLALVVVLVGVLVGAVMLLPGDRIANLAADKISAATGRQVTMSGDTRISIYPILGVSTGKVIVANADWSDQGPMFEAESLKIGVEPQALWGGAIRITGMEAHGPRVHLERAADGKVNWELGVEGVAPSGQAGGDGPAVSSWLALTLDRALIEDGLFIFDDHGTGQRTEITDMRLDLRWPEYEGRATFDMSLRPAGEEVRITGFLDRVGDFIDGAVSAAQAELTLPGGRMAFDGRISALPQADGALSAVFEDTNKVLTALGQPPAAIPEGFGRSLDAQTRITIAEGNKVSLRQIILDLGGNRLTGDADLDLSGKKPRIVAQIDAGNLDLTKLPSSDEPAAEEWSKEPIDASALGLANGEILFSADSIDTGTLRVGTTRTKMTLKRSRMVFELQQVQAYDGTVRGQFVVNNRNGLSVGGNVDVASISMQSFLAATAGIDRFSGAADAKLNFLGAGNSQHAIMNSLSGDGSFQTGRGVISGFDLDKLMRTGNGTGGTTIFDEMRATFTMNGGVLSNNDLYMGLPLAKADGAGTVGIGARNIDYLFTPVLLEGENRKGLAIPVRIRGPWSGPSIKPDLEKALELNLAEERKELEKKAKKEVRQAVEKELGLSGEEDGSLKDSLEDKALKGLKGLFD